MFPQGSTSFLFCKPAGKRSVGCIFHIPVLSCGKGCEQNGCKRIWCIPCTSAPGAEHDAGRTGSSSFTLRIKPSAAGNAASGCRTSTRWSRWPDALGLTLADLMHCHDSRQKDATPPVPLEDSFHMLRRQHTVDWRSVRTALLALSIALALWGIFACPGRLAVHWRTLSDGSLQADGWMSSLVIFPLFAGFEFLSLELWNNFEQTGYYRRWGEVNLFIIHAMSFGTPLTRLMRRRAGSSVLFLFWISASMLRSTAILLN